MSKKGFDNELIRIGRETSILLCINARGEMFILCQLFVFLHLFGGQHDLMSAFRECLKANMPYVRCMCYMLHYFN